MIWVRRGKVDTNSQANEKKIGIGGSGALLLFKI